MRERPPLGLQLRRHLRLRVVLENAQVHPEVVKKLLARSIENPFLTTIRMTDMSLRLSGKRVRLQLASWRIRSRSEMS